VSALKDIAPAQSFQDLLVWRKAHEFVLLVYKISADFPSTEQYGLTSQFRRAAVSIPANIAEGFRKKGLADKLRFYNIAQGSLEECRYYIILTKDLGYADTTPLQRAIGEVSKMLHDYIKKVANP
jgi:four helix bundle protein